MFHVAAAHVTRLLPEAGPRGRSGGRGDAEIGVNRPVRVGRDPGFVVEAARQLGRLGVVLARARAERRAFLSILSGLPLLGQVAVASARPSCRTGGDGASGCLPEVVDLRLALHAVASCRAASADVYNRGEDGGEARSPAVGGR